MIPSHKEPGSSTSYNVERDCFIIPSPNIIKLLYKTGKTGKKQILIFSYLKNLEQVEIKWLAFKKTTVMENNKMQLKNKV